MSERQHVLTITVYSRDDNYQHATERIEIVVPSGVNATFDPNDVDQLHQLTVAALDELLAKEKEDE